MSMNNLTPDSELRYIIQWFNEWSELQRDDFVPILLDYLTRETDGVYVNGVVSGMANADVMDKPMSLFQCRIKLFKEWAPKWPEEMKIQLKQKIMEIDPKIAEKIIEELKSLTGTEATTNGSTSAVEADEPVEAVSNNEVEAAEIIAPQLVTNEEVPPVA